MSLYSQRLVKVILLFFLSVAMLLLARVEYLVWNWAPFSHQDAGQILIAMLNGTRFDLAASAWLIVPPMLIAFVPWPSRFETVWRRTTLTIFLAVQIPFLLLNLLDVEFVNFVGRRMTADVLFLLGEAQGKAGEYFKTFAVLFAVNFLLTAFYVWSSWKIVCAAGKPRPAWFPTGKVARGVFALLVFLGFVIASRGGLQSKPISFVNANVFAAPLLNNLVLNTSFNILKNLEQDNLPRVKYFDSRDEMLRNLNGSAEAPSLLEGRRPQRPQNVVVIILESFGLEYWGLEKNGAGWTPFLDELAKKSLTFKNGYANGRRSIEGVAAVMTGIPAMMNEPFITSPFTANRFVGLGTALTGRGYDTSFFHGGHNGTMHFDSFMRSAGIEKYFGASEYPDKADDDGTWGIYDGPFLKWMLSKIGEFKTPFMTAWFSISSHHPYLIPPADQSKYPEGSLPIAKTIRYTDDSLRAFFAEAEKQPWFGDTLFVITADHTFRPPSADWDNELSRYRVPILFYRAGFQWPAEIDRDQVVQQIDILPSVTDFLGVAMPEAIALERSVFKPGERTATLFLDGNYILAAKDYFLQERRGEQPRMFAISDPSAAKPLDEPADRKRNLELRLNASKQYFSEGMWDNRLYR